MASRWEVVKGLLSTMLTWQWALTIVTIAIAIWLIVWLRSYFREDAEDADETLEMLTQFRDLHQEGSLSDDEFRLIRSRLSRQVQSECVKGQVEPKMAAAADVSSISIDTKSGDEATSLHQNAPAEEMEKSEGMSDETE